MREGQLNLNNSIPLQGKATGVPSVHLQPRIWGIIKLIVTPIDLDNEGRCTLKYNGHLL